MMMIIAQCTTADNGNNIMSLSSTVAIRLSGLLEISAILETLSMIPFSIQKAISLQVARRERLQEPTMAGKWIE